MRRPLLILLALSLSPSAAVSAQEGTDTAESRDTVTVLDGVFTVEQADRGEATFRGRCTGCHAPAFFQAGLFVRTWAGRPVRSLYRRMRMTMPEDNPGGLEPAEYASVIAYILSLNGFPAGETDLPSDEEALRLILMVEKPEGGG